MATLEKATEESHDSMLLERAAFSKGNKTIVHSPLYILGQLLRVRERTVFVAVKQQPRALIRTQ